MRSNAGIIAADTHLDITLDKWWKEKYELSNLWKRNYKTIFRG
jgi:hypothetical protein